MCQVPGREFISPRIAVQKKKENLCIDKEYGKLTRKVTGNRGHYKEMLTGISEKQYKVHVIVPEISFINSMISILSTAVILNKVVNEISLSPFSILR